MYKVYQNGMYPRKKGKWHFYKEMQSLEEVKEYIRRYGFLYKGTDKNGVVYYGDRWWNYIAAKLIKEEIIK